MKNLNNSIPTANHVAVETTASKEVMFPEQPLRYYVCCAECKFSSDYDEKTGTIYCGKHMRRYDSSDGCSSANY